MSFKKNDWTILKEQEQMGHVASMTGVVERVRTPLNDELSAYFRNICPDYKSVFDEEECEDILDAINDYLEENEIDKPSLSFPYSNGTDIYLVPITRNLQIKVMVADEYFGDGNYEKYIQVDFFVINEHTTKEDVDQLIHFIKKYMS